MFAKRKGDAHHTASVVCFQGCDFSEKFGLRKSEIKKKGWGWFLVNRKMALITKCYVIVTVKIHSYQLIMHGYQNMIWLNEIIKSLLL